MTKMKFYMLIVLALMLSLTFGSTVFADSLSGVTSSNLISIGSMHDITIHEPTMVSNLNLPSTISVITTEGNKRVAVQWSNYSGESINETTELSGKVVLPPSILNSTNIQLDVTQTVDYEGEGLCSYLGIVRGNNIINIPPDTTTRELISNLRYNGKTLPREMSPIVVDHRHNKIYNRSVRDGDLLEIIVGQYTHTYSLSIIVGPPSNSSLLLYIIPTKTIAVPITRMASSLNLPSIIRIDTTNGIVNLPVKWNIPVDLSISENVQISGTIVLPDNIYNLAGVQLLVYQRVNYRPIGLSSSLGIIIPNRILYIPVGTSVSSLICGLTNTGSYTLTFEDKDNNTLGTDATIVTGDILVVTNGNTNYNFYLSTKTSITH
ncbi:hypothetical protein [Clostridium sp.]|jgi:hypothetical protein|uniref:hypothetical protein n=1 Tax=Clostridium sp. TaxID=1506 RepID=UPI003EEB3388